MPTCNFQSPLDERSRATGGSGFLTPPGGSHLQAEISMDRSEPGLINILFCYFRYSYVYRHLINFLKHRACFLEAY